MLGSVRTCVCEWMYVWECMVCLPAKFACLALCNLFLPEMATSVDTREPVCVVVYLRGLLCMCTYVCMQGVCRCVYVCKWMYVCECMACKQEPLPPTTCTCVDVWHVDSAPPLRLHTTHSRGAGPGRGVRPATHLGGLDLLLERQPGCVCVRACVCVVRLLAYAKMLSKTSTSRAVCPEGPDPFPFTTTLLLNLTHYLTSTPSHQHQHHRRPTRLTSSCTPPPQHLTSHTSSQPHTNQTPPP
jgi:hypothetical protein